MVEAQYNLGLALAAMERYPEAIERFRRALAWKPDCADFHYNLSVALMRTGAIREAIGQAREAVRLQPDQAGHHRFLAWLIATHEESEGGRPKEAVEHAERACLLIGGRDIVYLDTLAAAYASAGRFDEAVSRAKEAWQMAEAAGQDALAEEIHIQLQLYRDRKPYREPVGSVGRDRP
jgi:tetratricopeptide (TPR) repeat protein